ncbi:hypothetical protein BpHYR1_052049 [Brachionus plicatilis]|uniref:Uncharacterized protein n=1 Tax=Brachionus plicatilis TaxID=10195 RepID=A0A3M7RHE2_BRAPC|nr:hypothetical protein BpHYR1_052049 [Brachionus plicatilis]
MEFTINFHELEKKKEKISLFLNKKLSFFEGSFILFQINDQKLKVGHGPQIQVQNRSWLLNSFIFDKVVVNFNCSVQTVSINNYHGNKIFIGH